MACGTTPRRYGASCANSTGVANGQPGGRASATSTPSSSGRRCAGRSLKKSAPRGPPDPLHRRKRTERAAPPGAHLGAARTNAGAAIPFQLETALGHRRHHLAKFLFPPLSRHHPHGPSAGFPESLAAPSARQTISHLGPPAAAPRTPGARVRGRPKRPAADRVPAELRPRTQPGRVSVGLLETPCLAQLLPGRPHRTRLLWAPGSAPHAPPPGAGTILLEASESVTLIFKGQ